ncbi:MAG: hypothetical protein AAF497_12215, partial [Planctomycetota bacterium]
DGQVIASSDDALNDMDPTTGLSGTAQPLAKSDLTSNDFWTTNPKDAGFRAVLPGAAGATQTYHVRVRMSDANLTAGNTSARLGGNYELGIRLSDIDEVAGSVIRFSDIRYATNGIDIKGLVAHSPLIGEAAEFEGNDTFATAQTLGNLLSSDRGVISVAGNLSDGTDVDWYTFDVDYVDTQLTDVPTSVVFDLDYSDQLGRANTAIYIYDDTGTLVYVGEDSNTAEDLPGPLDGTGLTDISRGSIGGLDPFIGPVVLPPGTYSVAVTSRANIPSVLQDTTANSPGGAALNGDPLLRREPAPIVARVTEDGTGGSAVWGTADRPPFGTPPPFLLDVDGDSVVPLHLGDVPIFISSGEGPSSLTLVDAITGEQEGTIGNGNGPVADDIAMRWNGEIITFSSAYNGHPAADIDDEVGNYLVIDPVDGTVIENRGDDGIETWEEGVDEEGMPNGEADRSTPDNDDGVGIHFTAILVSIGEGVEKFYAIGHRPAAFNMPQSIDDVENILFELSPTTGAAIGDVRPEEERIMGTGLSIVELGVLDTSTAGDTMDVLTVSGGDAGDGDGFVANGQRFELVTGPMIEFDQDPDAAVPRFVEDGNSFTLQDPNTVYSFETGPVLEVLDGAAGVADGDTVTITSDTFEAVTFEFERIVDGNGDGVTTGNVAVNYNDNDNQISLTNKLANAIEDTNRFNVGTVVVAGSRISLVNDALQAGSEPISSTANVAIRGTVDTPAGEIPVFVEEFWDSSADVDIDGRPQTVNDIVEARAFHDAIIDATVAFMPSSILADSQINWPGATTGDFSEIENRGVFIDSGNDGFAAPGSIAIPFGIGWSSGEIAQAIAQAMNGAGITGTVAAGTNVTIGSGNYNSADNPPFTIGGTAPGGLITGLAEIEVNGAREVFGVSDTGGLFSIVPAAATITSISAFAGQDFQGLSAGPVNVEDGRFADKMFAVTGGGDIYAFDSNGALQPVFADGTGIVSTGVGGADGIEFGKIDYNLWHLTNNRSGDAGHAWDPPFDRSR